LAILCAHCCQISFRYLYITTAADPGFGERVCRFPSLPPHFPLLFPPSLLTSLSPLPTPSHPFPSFLSLPLTGSLPFSARRTGERCKFPQWGPGQSPGCISSFGIYGAQKCVWWQRFKSFLYGTKCEHFQPPQPDLAEEGLVRTQQTPLDPPVLQEAASMQVKPLSFVIFHPANVNKTLRNH